MPVEALFISNKRQEEQGRRQHHPETRSLTQNPRTQTRRPAYIQRFSPHSKIQLRSKRGRSSPKGFKGGLTLSRDRSKTLSKTLSLKGIGAHEWTTRHSPTRLELSACGLRAGNGADNELSDCARHDPTQHGSRSQLVQRQLGKHRRSTDGSSTASSAINGGSGCRRHIGYPRRFKQNQAFQPMHVSVQQPRGAVSKQ